MRIIKSTYMQCGFTYTGIIDRVEISNHVNTGSGAIVNKSFEEDTVFFADVPEKIV